MFVLAAKEKRSGKRSSRRNKRQETNKKGAGSDDKKQIEKLKDKGRWGEGGRDCVSNWHTYSLFLVRRTPICKISKGIGCFMNPRIPNNIYTHVYVHMHTHSPLHVAVETGHKAQGTVIISLLLYAKGTGHDNT